jgi:hypothetical protein
MSAIAATSIRRDLVSSDQVAAAGNSVPAESFVMPRSMRRGCRAALPIGADNSRSLVLVFTRI